MGVADEAAAELEYLDAQGVADRFGLSVVTVRWHARGGTMPDPDRVFRGRRLWLPSTVDAWRARGRRKLGEPAPGSPRGREKSLEPALAGPAPKLAGGATWEALGVRVDPAAGEPVSEAVAARVAAELRAEGVHCTTADALELAGAAEQAERGRETLRQRVVATSRLLRDKAP